MRSYGETVDELGRYRLEDLEAELTARDRARPRPARSDLERRRAKAKAARDRARPRPARSDLERRRAKAKAARRARKASR